MVVIDTSVAYKWFSAESEEHLALALKLLEAHLRNIEAIIVPDIMVYELANAWATKTKLSFKQIKTFLEDLKEIEIKIEPITIGLISNAVEFSKSHHVSVYDASYAVLAKEKGCDLITADSKFIEMVKLPFVKNLKNY